MGGRHEKTDWQATAAAWQKTARSFLPTVYYVLTCFCVFTVALVLLTAFFRPCTVYGESMIPTLQNGDQLLLNCWESEPQYGDIVAIRRENEIPLIKRVIAVAGDTMYIDGATGEVYRNGALLDEPYLSESTPPKQLVGEITVPEGQLFVMGDNRSDSHDSRYKDIGLVSVDNIIGTAVFRFYPLSEWGGL